MDKEFEIWVRGTLSGKSLQDYYLLRVVEHLHKARGKDPLEPLRMANWSLDQANGVERISKNSTLLLKSLTLLEEISSNCNRFSLETKLAFDLIFYKVQMLLLG